MEYIDTFAITEDGLELVNCYDARKDLAKTLIRNISISHEPGMAGCNLVYKNGIYHVFKDPTGQYFGVDLTKDIKHHSEYEKADSLYELTDIMIQRGLKFYSEYDLREHENIHIRNLIFGLKSRTYTTDEFLSAPVRDALQSIKQRIGAEAYRNMDEDMTIVSTHHRIIDLENLAHEVDKKSLDILRDTQLIRLTELPVHKQKQYMPPVLHTAVNDIAKDMSQKFTELQITYKDELVYDNHPMLEELSEGKYLWKSTKALADSHPDTYDRIKHSIEDTFYHREKE